MIKRLISIFCFLFLTSTYAISAERAEFNLIGYSPEGKYFAFEEYGIQDGSGFAYSNVFLIDLEADEWVGGSPFRMRADDETTSLADIRYQAIDAATQSIDLFDISQPARLIALNGDGEQEAKDLTLDFSVPGYSDPSSFFASYELSFDIYTAPSGENCMDYFGEKAKGFRLLLDDKKEVKILHEDVRVPASRGCPVTYRASAVVLPFGATNISRGVALISVWSFGFEGWDRRYVAVPLSATK